MTNDPAQITPAAEVVTDPVYVWVIVAGAYDDARPVAVVHGTEADAQRAADTYNTEVPWTDPDDRAHVGAQVPFYGPPVQ